MLTATSASKAWNLPGLMCAEVILSNEPDRQQSEDRGPFASHGASDPGVVADLATFRHGEPWADEVLAYLDESRKPLADPVSQHLPRVRYRPAGRDVPGRARLHPDGPGLLARRADRRARSGDRRGRVGVP